MADVEVLGLKELDRKVRELTSRTGKNFLAPALRKAANVIRDTARNTAPKGNDDDLEMAEQIKVRRDSNPQQKGQNEIMYVKPFETKKFPVYYWRFVEFGTVKQSGKRYLTRAFDSKKKAAVKEFMQSVSKAIIRETKKLNKL